MSDVIEKNRDVSRLCLLFIVIPKNKFGLLTGSTFVTTSIVLVARLTLHTLLLLNRLRPDSSDRPLQ